MKVTRSHVEYWAARCAPQFIRQALQPNPKSPFAPHVVTVFNLIPSGLPIKIQRDCDWHNVLVSLKGARKRGGTFDYTGFRGGIIKSPTPILADLLHLVEAYPNAKGKGLQRPQHNRKGAIVRRLLKRLTSPAKPAIILP
jgi:hypothetical protein